MGFTHNRFKISLFRILLMAVRFLQFALAITVCVLYGIDLEAAMRQNRYVDSKWLYAEIVGAMSVFVSLFSMIPWEWVLDIPFSFAADIVLFILWLAVFGVFGHLYFGTDPQGDGGEIRMHHAIWVDFTNALLWALTGALMATYWSKGRNSRSRFTGRGAL